MSFYSTTLINLPIIFYPFHNKHPKWCEVIISLWF